MLKRRSQGRSLVFAAVGIIVGLVVGQQWLEARRPPQKADTAAPGEAPTSPDGTSPYPLHRLEGPDPGVAPVSLPEGTVILRVAEDGYTIRVADASRLDVLRKLAELAEFELVDHALQHPWVSLQLEDVSLEEILARLLEDTRFSVDYEVSNFGGGVRIALLELEPPPRQARAALTPGSEKKVREEKKRNKKSRRDKKSDEKGGDGEEGGQEEPEETEEQFIVHELTESQQREFMEGREERQREWREEGLADLESIDPRDRKGAVIELDADLPEDVARLKDLLLEDPDSSVRLEAAEGLGFGEPDDTVWIFEQALDDSSPEVLVEVLNALSIMGDQSVLPKIRTLKDHPFEEVREAAGYAEDSLMD